MRLTGHRLRRGVLQEAGARAAPEWVFGFGKEFFASERVPLPSGQLAIAFSKEFFESLEHVQLPIVANGEEFFATLERVQLPCGLQVIAFGKEFLKRLEGVQLPSGPSPSARGSSRPGSTCSSRAASQSSPST